MLNKHKNFKNQNLNWDFEDNEYDYFKKQIWPRINAINGFLSFNESFFLYLTAKNLKKKSRNIDIPEEKSVLEIGAFHGKSTVSIALGLKENINQFKLFSIDPIFKDEVHKNKTISLLNNFEVENLVELIPTDSETAFKNWDKNLFISMLWIDGNHEYDYVSLDFRNWTKYLMPNGNILFHDFYLLGVNKTIRENIFNSEIYSDLKFIDGNLLFAKKNDMKLSNEHKFFKIRTIMAIHCKSTSIFYFILFYCYKFLLSFYNFLIQKPKKLKIKNIIK